MEEKRKQITKEELKRSVKQAKLLRKHGTNDDNNERKGSISAAMMVTVHPLGLSKWSRSVGNNVEAGTELSGSSTSDSLPSPAGFLSAKESTTS